MSGDLNGVNPLFVGLTRPVMLFGVTYEAVVMAFLAAFFLFLVSNNVFLFLLYVPVHFGFYLICLRDPRCFRLLFIYSNTHNKSKFRVRFGAATGSPMANNRMYDGKKR